MSNDPFATPVADPFMAQGGGNPSLSFPEIGTTHTGVITEVKERNDTKPDGTLKTWPDGNPMKVYVMTLDNNGELGDLWVRGNMVKKIREAAQAAGATTVVGWKLTIRHNALGEPPQRGYAAPKLFQAKLEPAPARAAAFAAEEPF